MFGYACDETPELMPAPHPLRARAHPPARRRPPQEARPGSAPTARARSRCEYKDGQPGPHRRGGRLHPARGRASSNKKIHEAIMRGRHPQGAARRSCIDKKTKFFINPTGRFVIGGPMGDSGVTGRKIIVDTYGGMGRHGGGAFSRQGPDEGRPLGRVHGPLHRQERGRRRASPRRCEVQVSLRHRRRRAGQRDGRDLRHRARSPRSRSPAPSARCSASSRARSSSTSTCCGPSTRRPPRTVTSAAPRRSSPGSAPTRRTRSARRWALARSGPSAAEPPAPEQTGGPGPADSLDPRPGAGPSSGPCAQTSSPERRFLTTS